MTIYYTYYSYEEWGRGYIGKRKCPLNKTPETDDYFGSFRDKTFKPTQKIILSLHSSDKEALETEILLHEFFHVDTNPYFANRSKQVSSGFSTTNSIPWNKGKRGVQQAWNKGKKGSQKAWNKGALGTGTKHSWIHPLWGEEFLTVSEMCLKYPQLIAECLYRLKNGVTSHHYNWKYIRRLDNQQP